MYDPRSQLLVQYCQFPHPWSPKSIITVRFTVHSQFGVRRRSFPRKVQSFDGVSFGVVLCFTGVLLSFSRLISLQSSFILGIRVFFPRLLP